MGQILAEVLPPGVLNVVTGGDDLGKLLVQHPGVQKLGFTGSVESGRHVALAAAARNLDVTLELGGNDPAILLEDIDLETAATKLFWGAFGNAGQLCAAIKRVYAPRSRYDEVVTALAAKARSVKVGAGNVEGVKLGPLCNRPQFDRVRELVDDALASGGVAVEGGEALDGPGFFFPPTIVADARDGMRLVDEEQFGPALPFVPYDDLDEVIATVNSSRFGLGSSVWSADADRAWAVGHEIDAGMVWLNAHGVVSPRLPFGGIRDSGHGLENGLVGLREYTQARVRQRR
jgi:acyl-CoA reductase-like NAD-dependent aldehyde dehydrogenase